MDCPWAKIARASDFRQSLKTEAPHLLQQLEQDGLHPEWLSLWGNSLNWDEGARNLIVKPQIIDSLLELTHAPPRQDRIVHAGIMHIYAYLFSTLRTHFGFKRARWVEGEMERGLGLRPGIFSPQPPSGTQFANVTFALARMGLLGEPGVDRLLLKRNADLDSSLLAFRFQDLEITRLLEVADGISLRTDFVQFPTVRSQKNASTGNTHLLVYSVKEKNQLHARLITAFPVNTSFVQKVLNEKNHGLNVPITSRYNAYVPGITDVQPPKRGIRKTVDRPS